MGVIRRIGVIVITVSGRAIAVVVITGIAVRISYSGGYSTVWGVGGGRYGSVKAVVGRSH
jgi:hypothetical protein